MALHLIKLAVGVDDLAHMKKVQAARRRERGQSARSPHWVYTRNSPRRAEDLQGGSLYWVVRGVIRCRQELVGFEDDFDEESGKVFCLVEAPDKEAAIAVHREAHGLVADEITEVEEGL